MKKLLYILIGFSILGVPHIYASNINIRSDSQKFNLEKVDLQSAGCSNNFGFNLQNDLNADQISMQISTDYSIEKNRGLVSVNILNKQTNLSTSVSLLPLGIAKHYAFGAYNRPSMQISINNHAYSIFGILYSTIGVTSQEWTDNGRVSVLFQNPLQNGRICTAYSLNNK